VSPDASFGTIRGTVPSTLGTITVDVTVTAALEELPTVTPTPTPLYQCVLNPCHTTIQRRGFSSGTITSSTLGAANVAGSGILRKLYPVFP
jgi:hypothetical protein